MLQIANPGSDARAAQTQPARPKGEVRSFNLRDDLGRDWKSELVIYPVATSLYGRRDLTLIGPDERAQAFQWTTSDAGQKAIAFLATVAKFGSSTYSLRKGRALQSTDIKVTENADIVQLVNGVTGVALRRKLAQGEAPIAGVRMASGKWVGASSLHTALPLKNYSARVLARGPVFAEVLCVAEFGNGKSWSQRVRLQSGEPVAIVCESYNLSNEAKWTLDLSSELAPDQLFYRGSKERAGEVSSWKIAGESTQPAYVLEPWLHWNYFDRQGNWFGVYNESDPDLLAIGALNAGQWIDPKLKNFSNGKVIVTAANNKLAADWPLQSGQRRWMLAAFDKGTNLEFLKAGNNRQPPPPQQYVIKHGDFPLDMVKDYVLQWPSDDSAHPRLLLTKSDIARIRQSFKPDEGLLKVYQVQGAGVQSMEPMIRYYIGSGDEKLGRNLAETSKKWLQEAVDLLTQQKSNITIGYAPHHLSSLLGTIYLADAVWANALTAEERARMKAQIAFLAYTVSRADYWSPERNYRANPNMTTSVHSYQMTLGAMAKSHPKAREWMTSGLSEIKRQLHNWSDENGGWLEAPHYAALAQDYLVGMLLLAHNAGIDQDLYHPRMKKIAEWFAQTSTPPDPRGGGLRHMPPVGNTYLNEPTGMFGIMAGLWKERDPQFAAEMQWMFKQHGSWPDHGIGGIFPGVIGYRGMLSDSSIVEKKPNYVSTLFPETGIILRNGVDDRETQLHMIAGNNHEHSDYDSGSFTLWGKGRIVADDFGYQGRMPEADHNMVDTGDNFYSRMIVQEFSPSPHFDYVHGRTTNHVRYGHSHLDPLQGPVWHRRIAFVKDADFMAPNYFVIRDTLETAMPLTWRMWVDGAVTLKPQGALVQGKSDVDTDIIFVAPQNVALTTESKTRQTAGVNEKRQANTVSLTQQGIISTAPTGAEHFVVLYPRLKTQVPPKVTALADGRAVMVETEAGTDYVFLGDKRFTFEQGDIKFEGTSGLIKIRGDAVELSLGGAGSLSARGKRVEKATDDVVKRGNL